MNFSVTCSVLNSKILNVREYEKRENAKEYRFLSEPITSKNYALKKKIMLNQLLPIYGDVMDMM